MLKRVSIIRWFGKFFVANLLAIGALSVVCCFYYNPGLQQAPLAGETEYRWEPNRWVARANEGIIWGRFDRNGYNNAYYREYYPTDSKVDVLTIGSSHMEAMNVPMNRNAAYLLNRDFASTNGLRVYNIGIAGQDIYKILTRYENATRLFRPKYAVIETSVLPFDDQRLKTALTNSFPPYPIYCDWKVSTLEKIKISRQLFAQWKNFKKNNARTPSAETKLVPAESDQRELEDDLQKAFGSIARISQEYEVRPIVLYHTQLKLNENGSCSISAELDEIARFRRLCEQNGIVFVDMTNVFVEEYEKNRRLPYGFSNTQIGVGHLNSLGHRLIADALRDEILSLENESEDNR